MPSPFEEAVAAIRAALATDNVVGSQLSDGTLAWGVLRLAQQETDTVRRIVWIPIEFANAPLQTSNPRCAGPGTPHRSAMYREVWAVECHIVGANMADVEDLRERVLYATRLILGTGGTPSGGMWITQAAPDAAVMNAGAEKVIQRFQWQLFVLEPENASGSATTITRIDTTVADQGAPPERFTQPKQ